MTMPVYAIGDIHGQIEMLERVLERIEQDGGPDAKIIFLGDYTDRGPESKSVIERLSTGLSEGRNWNCIKGNHDRMFEWFMEDVPRHDPHLLVGYHWLHERLGGTDTLASYGINFSDRTRLKDVHTMAMEVVPQSHVEFLRGLDLTHETDDLFFTHAGILPEKPLEDQVEEDLLWIREPFHKHTGQYQKLVIHGHTPVGAPTHHGNRVNLDTGAGYGKPLTAAVFERATCWVLTDRGRELLRPEVS